MIFKNAKDPTKFKRKEFFTNSAREAWSLLLQFLDKQKTVLLPSYIGQSKNDGSGIMDPVRKSNLKFDFYEITNTLNPNLKDVFEKVKKNKVNVILLVNYFGFCPPDSTYNALKNHCKKNNILLVQDCAHYFNYYNETRISDFMFYSIHKYLPVCGGGILVSNYDLNIKNNNSFLNKNYKEIVLEYNLKNILRIRHKNFFLYYNKIKKLKNIFVLKDMNFNLDIPHNFPIIVKNNKREDLYFYLIKNGVEVTALYYNMVEEISKSEYPVSYQISNSILNLPLHQDISEKDIDKVVSILKKWDEGALR